MPKYGCLCISGLTTVLFFLNGNCQTAYSSDSVFYHNAISNVKATFFSALKEKSNLYNGAAYDAYGHGASGTPFFIADTIVKGPVFYDGFLYEDVPLKYDMVNDELLSTYYYDNSLLRLVKNKVGYFYIGGHYFIRLDENEKNLADPSGFCELLYNDKKTLVLAKRTKKLQLSANAEDRSSVFVQYNQYFVYKDNQYLPVNSEGDLIKIFNDKAQEIKNFMRGKKIRYKKNTEQAIVTVASFYNGLTK